MTFLARAVKATASGSAGFRDVADSAYYAKAVKWATDNAITNGIAPGRFRSRGSRFFLPYGAAACERFMNFAKTPCKRGKVC